MEKDQTRPTYAGKTKTCKGCGKEILFARIVGSQGEARIMPLDYRALCYSVADDGTCHPARGVFVTHFATCPEAQRFSGRARSRVAGQGGEKPGETDR